MFVLKLLGGASIHGPDGRIGGPASQKHRLALLALLATSAGRSVPRQKLMSYLWPERDAAHAGNLLNQCVYTVRRTLGQDMLLSGGDALGFDDRRLSVDVGVFRKARAADDPESAARCYGGPFMDGFVLPAAWAFEEWVAGERERLRLAYLSVLESLAARAEAAQDAAAALAWWRLVLNEEPHAARVILGLMNALERSGDRAAALRLAHTHASAIRQEFQAEPNPDVARLVERMRSAPRGSDSLG